MKNNTILSVSTDLLTLSVLLFSKRREITLEICSWSKNNEYEVLNVGRTLRPTLTPSIPSHHDSTPHQTKRLTKEEVVLIVKVTLII